MNEGMTGYNTAMGETALRDTSSGQGNTAYGYATMPTNTAGSYNTAHGYMAANNITT